MQKSTSRKMNCSEIMMNKIEILLEIEVM